jgi:ectoine hydroxylase-related dioxygenase (phytanoyl-CoA dioxygenase family)
MQTMSPLETDRAMDTHQMRLRNAGYTIIENALPPDLLHSLRARFDALLPAHGELPTAARPDTPSRDMNHLCEIEPLFDQLITYPSVFPIAELYMKGDIELLACTIGNFMPAHTPARVPWHRDGDYVRLTYILSDVEPHGGPTAVLPGTHREEEGPPRWLNTDDGYPRAVPGMVKITAKAGSCMVNDTRIWHSSTPNDSDVDRKLVWIVFKTRAQPITGFTNLRHRQAYIDRQTDPTMRRLLGIGQ